MRRRANVGARSVAGHLVISWSAREYVGVDIRRGAGGKGLVTQHLACGLPYFCLGFAGPRKEAEAIKEQLATFLRESLKLELSVEKTLITHASTEPAHFLGYDLIVQRRDDKHDATGRRAVNGHVALRLPAEVLHEKCALYMRQGKPRHRSELLADDDFTTITRYQSEYRGFVNYYLLAQNVSWLWHLHWVMSGSLLKTLANKHQCSVRHIARQYRATVTIPEGTFRCLEKVVPREGKLPLVARFGGMALRRQPQATITDGLNLARRPPERNELVTRLMADRCEHCTSTEQVEVHHIRKLADLTQPGRKTKPWWVYVMAARRRKTLVLCHECHVAIHAGKWQGLSTRTR